ncbi:MAG: HesA/MoeB/ThiF family protein [Paracoccaceae bacterium]
MAGLVILIGVFVAGWYFRLPRALVWGVICILWAGLMIYSAPVLPQHDPLVPQASSTFIVLLLAGIFTGVFQAYRFALGRLRARAAEATPQVAKAYTPTFTDAELDRYARHIILREIGGSGQKKLKAAKVLVVGAGGLGSPALMYLAAAGVGTIGVIDADVVDTSNLQRQIIHTDARIGMPKVFSAEQAMRAVNPFVAIRPYNRSLDEATAESLIADYDIVLDGTDNFATRYLVNRTCVALGKPLVSAAITQWEGQVSLYHPAAGAPCYACVFPQAPAPGLAPACAEAGVMGALPGVVGSMMAVEAIKWITGAGQSLAGRLLIYDALYAENRVIGIHRRVDCAVCGGNHPQPDAGQPQNPGA